MLVLLRFGQPGSGDGGRGEPQLRADPHPVVAVEDGAVLVYLDRDQDAVLGDVGLEGLVLGRAQVRHRLVGRRAVRGGLTAVPAILHPHTSLPMGSRGVERAGPGGPGRSVYPASSPAAHRTTDAA